MIPNNRKLGVVKIKRNLPLADRENEDKRSDVATRFPQYANKM